MASKQLNTNITLLIFSPNFRILKAEDKTSGRKVYRYVDEVNPQRSQFTRTYPEAFDLVDKYQKGVTYSVINTEHTTTATREMRGDK